MTTSPWLVTFHPHDPAEYSRYALNCEHAVEMSQAFAARSDRIDAGNHVCFIARHDETGETFDCRDLHEPSHDGRKVRHAAS